VVYHDGYGCDTGCCGHTVEVDGKSKFIFDHPFSDEDKLEFAKQMVRDAFGEEHVADLDWENSYIYNGCEYY
jgi:hypothetical protein